jgi:outer membrane protein assembly factor BamB
MNSTIRRLILATCAVSAAVGAAVGADWPMWRYDAHRSAATPEQLPAQLNLQWTHEYPAPASAWDNQKEEEAYGGPGRRAPQMVSFDVAYQPIVVGNIMYFGSPNSDCLIRINTITGEELGRFYADGPIRFAPVAKNGKIYFGSDDGYLYCLDAISGNLITRNAAFPTPRKVLGNDRLISVWPVRGGPVISSDPTDNNTLYYASGLYPFEGTAVFALNTSNGQRKWLNDGSSMYYTVNPHGTAEGYNGLSPQGYLCIADSGKLIIPNGRSVPACLDRTTGNLLYYRIGQVSGGGYHVASQGNTFYCRSSAYNLSNGNASGSAPAQFDGDKCQITAGTTVYSVSSTSDNLPSYSVTSSDGTFSTNFDSRPAGLVAANGHLFISTVNGSIYCYGADSVASPKVYPTTTVNTSSDEMNGFTAQLIKASGYKTGSKGICLIIGLSNGRLAEEIALQSDMTVIGVDPDQKKVNSIRTRLDKEGLYGAKIQLIVGDIHSIEFPPYMAQLIISEDINSGLGSKVFSQSTKDKIVSSLYKILRPYGGVMILATNRTSFDHAISDRKLLNAEVSMISNYTLVRKVGALPNSADWTSQYADAAHSNFVKDSLVKGPMGVLWFGGSADNTNNKMNPRHGHGPSEQVSGGHYYMQGPDHLRCVDAYTGRILWEKTITNFGQFSDYTEHEAGQIALGDNYVSFPDAVYALGEHDDNMPPKVCYVLDPATGETKKTITMPDSLGGWGLLSVCDSFVIATSAPLKFDADALGSGWAYWYGSTNMVGVGGLNNLNGTAGSHIVVFNRFTGEKLWNIKAEHGYFNNAVVAGNGKLYAIDKLPQAVIGYLDRMGMPDTITSAAKVKAFDLSSGTLLWADSTNTFARYLAYSKDHDILLQASRYSRDYVKSEPSARTLVAHNGSNGSVLWQYLNPSPSYYGGPIILSDTIIYTQDGNNFGALNLLSGTWHMDNFGLTDKATDFYFYRHYGCAYGMGTPNMITFRTGNGGYYDLTRQEGAINWSGFKTGCTPSLVPGNGIVTSAEYTRTCDCNYQIQTSCALVNSNNVDTWSSNEGFSKKFKNIGAKLTNVGINLGAPGDRRDDNGTLWCEFPFGETAAGFSAYPIPLTINVTGDSVSYFRHHSSTVSGNGAKWIAASGVEGASTVTLRMVKDSLDGTTVIPYPITAEKYKATLVFMEPNRNIKIGQRVFDVAVNGVNVATDLDIVKLTGGINRVYTVEVPGIDVSENLTVSLIAKTGKPVLSGFSAVVIR